MAVVIVSTVYVFLALAAIMTATIAPVYMDIFQSNDAVIQKQAAKSFILVSEKLAVALATVFVFTIVPLIVVTHRIFGPLINFSNTFQRVSDGDLTARVNLRRGDFLKTEAAHANEMLQSLEAAVTELREQNHRLVTTLDGLVDGQSHGNETNGEIRDACNQAHACEALLSRLQTAVLPGQKDKEGAL